MACPGRLYGKYKPGIIGSQVDVLVGHLLLSWESFLSEWSELGSTFLCPARSQVWGKRVWIGGDHRIGDKDTDLGNFFFFFFLIF